MCGLFLISDWLNVWLLGGSWWLWWYCRICFIQYLLVFLLLVFAGRWLMSFWTGTAKIHELYTAACGLYVCWLTIRAVTVLVAWMPQGRQVIFQKVKEWSLMVSCWTTVFLGIVGWWKLLFSPQCPRTKLHLGYHRYKWWLDCGWAQSSQRCWQWALLGLHQVAADTRPASKQQKQKR